MAVRRISLGKAVLELDTDLDPFLKGLDTAGQKTKQFGAQASVLGSTMASVFGGVTLASLAANVVSFGANLLRSAGALQDLHERTSISVEGLQRLTIVAEQSGSSIDAVATAVFQMGKRLAGGDDNASDAIAQLGLNFTELRNSRPEDAFNTIGMALGALEDPMKRAELGAKIFGRSVDDLMPTFVNLSKETGAYVTLSARQVELLDRIGDAFVRVKASLVPFAVQFIDHVFMVSKAIDAWKLFLGIVNPNEQAVGLDKQTSAYARMTKSMEANKKAVESRALVLGQAAVSIGEAEKELTTAFAEKEKKLKAVAKAVDDTQKKNETFRASVVNLTSSANGAAAGFGAFGMLMPNLSSQTLKFADATIYLASALDDANLGVEDLERNGRFLSAALLKTQGSIATLITSSSQFGDEIREVVEETADLDRELSETFIGPIQDVQVLSRTITDNLGGALKSLPELLVKAFTGGGGIAGAFKAFGVQLANAIIEPLMAKMTQAAALATSLGASLAGAIGGKVGGGAGALVGGLAGTIGGGAIAAGTGLGAAAAAGSIAATVALGAATMGIGAAAVGAYVGIKKLYSMIGPSKEEKAARTAIGELTSAITGTMTAAQKAEAAQAGWAGADTLIVIRDGYLAAGHSAQEAEAMVAKLWDSSQDGGKHTKEIIDQINAVMVQGAENAAKLADEAAAASLAQQEAEAAAETAREARLNEFQARIDEMMARRDSLIKSVEKEAPERVMGVIEKAQRAEIASLDKRMAEEKVKMSIAADEMAKDISDALGKLEFKVKLKGEWHIPDMPRMAGVEGMAAGGIGRVTRPTLFLAGEGGPEDFAFSGGNRSFGSGGSDGAGLAAIVEEVAALRRDFKFSIPNSLAKASVTAAAKSGS